MSVVIMLLWLWWGLLGFLAVAVGVWAFVSVLGQKSRIVFALLVCAVGGHLVDRYLYAEQHAAEGFIGAWAAESADFPDGLINTPAIGRFLDYDRLGSVNPYLAEHWRMRYHSPVRAAGKETIVTEGDHTAVKTEVYLADVRVHGSEHDVDFRAKLRIWVGTDNDRVAQFKFEGIEFL